MVGPVDQAAFLIPDELAFDGYQISGLDWHIWCHFRVVCHQNCRAIGKDEQKLLVRQTSIVVLKHFFHWRCHCQGHLNELQILRSDGRSI